MNVWALFIKEEDGFEKIVKGGLNLVDDGEYSRMIITDELHARQIDKLEIVDGQLKVREGLDLTPLKELNKIEVN